MFHFSVEFDIFAEKNYNIYIFINTQIGPMLAPWTLLSGYAYMILSNMKHNPGYCHGVNSFPWIQRIKDSIAIVTSA